MLESLELLILMVVEGSPLNRSLVTRLGITMKNAWRGVRQLG